MRIWMMISWIHKFCVIFFYTFLLINNNVYASYDYDKKMNVLIDDFKLIGLHNIENTSLFQTIVNSFRKDLEISGVFELVDDDEEHVSAAKKIRRNNIDILLTGFIEFIPENNQISLVLRVFDITMEELVVKKVVHTNYTQCKHLGHVMADEIYKNFVGGENVFNSNLVFLERKNVDEKIYKRLTLMDPNGENKKYLSSFVKNINNPSVSSNHQYLAYVKFTKEGNSKIVVKNLASKQEYLVGGGVYNASSPPRFSPDNKAIVYSLSQGSYTNIYTYNWVHGTNKILTNKIKGINTSPSYSPNGRQVIFSSDNSGETGLYKINIGNQKIFKITKRGTYTNPVWSPTGEYIAFTKIIKNKFYLGVIRPDGTGERLIAKDFVLESPSWSSNGRYIVFSRQNKQEGSETMRSKLYFIDVLNLHEVNIENEFDASSPFWTTARKM